MTNLTPGRITWLGHATFMITTCSGKSILIDPWVMNNPKCPEELKQLDAVDLVLITHAHDDHTRDAIEIVQKFQPSVFAIAEIGRWLESNGAEEVSRMNKGGTQAFGDVKVSMVHADHSSGIAKDGAIAYGGEPVGFVIELEDGFRIYHAGDTAVFGDMRLIGKYFHPDVACLPIGGHFTMGPTEAADAIELLGVKHVIPMHYGTMAVLKGTPDQLQSALAGTDVNVIALEPGGSIEARLS